jgi:signal peptidase II
MVKKILGRIIDFKVFFSIVICVLILDQIIKSIILAKLTTPITLIPSVLTLTKATNTGVAFGFLGSYQIIVQIITGAIIIASVYFLPKLKREYIIPAAFVIGGALGNFVDRLAYGHVIDYLFLRYFSIFNLADMCITFGIVWIIYLELFKNKEQKKLDK